MHVVSEGAHLQVLNEMHILKNTAKITGKHLCWSFLLMKLQPSRLPFYLKRDSRTGVFL